MFHNKPVGVENVPQTDTPWIDYYDWSDSGQNFVNTSKQLKTQLDQQITETQRHLESLIDKRSHVEEFLNSVEPNKQGSAEVLIEPKRQTLTTDYVDGKKLVEYLKTRNYYTSYGHIMKHKDLYGGVQNENTRFWSFPIPNPAEQELSN